MARAIQHYRCPCCGKLSRGQNYGQAATTQGHLLESVTQHFIGGPGRGFRWERRSVNASDLPFLRYLLSILDRVRARLASAIASLESQERIYVPMLAPSYVPMHTPQTVAFSHTSDTTELHEREESPVLVNEVRFA